MCITHSDNKSEKMKNKIKKMKMMMMILETTKDSEITEKLLINREEPYIDQMHDQMLSIT